MKSLVVLALALLMSAAVEACGGGGSGGPSTGSPLPVGDGDPAPPSGDPPGPSSGRSGGSGACPCAGSYSCNVNGLEAGVETIDVVAGDGTCQWSSGTGGSALQLGCNGSTGDNGYEYTSSWSGSTLTLCLDSQQGQPSCIQCTSDGAGQ